MKIGKIFMIVSFLLFAQWSEILAQKKLEIDSNEKAVRKEKLKKLNKESFHNKSNEKADEETRKQDMELGKKLSTMLNAAPEKSHQYKGVIARRFESKEEGKFGGDILDMTQDAKFGHINAIVRVLTGYIQNSFGYQLEDSELLALYVVYYNYKHRNNISYVGQNFGSEYKTSLKKDKLGIPENFAGWAGKTEVLIPIERNVLKDGGLDIATYELEDQVNPDIDAQKGGAEAKKKFANLQTRKIKSEKDDVTQKYEQVLKRERELLDRKKAIEDRLAELMKDPEKNKAEIAKLLAEKKKIDAELAEIQIEKKDLETKIEQINRREEMRRLGFTSEKEYLAYLASKKKPEVIEEKKIVVEEKKIEAPPAKKEPEVVITPPTKVGKNYVQAIHSKGKVILVRESITIPGGGLIAIGYEAPVKDNPELTLFLVGTGEFEIVKVLEGIKLSNDSPLTLSEGKILIFESFNGQTYLSQLNTQLELEFRSSEPVDPDSSISVLTESIQVTKNKKTGAADDVKSFKKKDLSISK